MDSFHHEYEYRISYTIRTGIYVFYTSRDIIFSSTSKYLPKIIVNRLEFFKYPLQY